MATTDTTVPIWMNSDDKCECPWGVIEHPRIQLEDYEVGALILVSGSWIHHLLAENRPSACASVKLDQGRMYLHIEHRQCRWVWELHEARWDPTRDTWGVPNAPRMLYVGRWPD